MKNYFLPDLTVADKAKLQEREVVFLPFPALGEGILLEDGDLESVLVLLEKKIIGEEKTTYMGVLKLHLVTEKIDQALKDLPPITVECWEGQNRSDFVTATRDKLLINLTNKKPVKIHVPHKKTKEPMDDDCYHVLLWSSPKEGRYIKPPTSIFGITTQCRDEAFQPSGTGYILFDENTNYSPAEIVGNNIYVHHDICHYGELKEVRQYEIMMEKAAAILNLDPAARKAAETDSRQKFNQAKRESYIRFCSGRFLADLSEVTQAAQTIRQETAKLEQQLLQKIRDGQFYENRLASLQHSRQEAMAVYGQEFDRLLDHPQIIDLEFDAKSLIVYTNTILCLDPRSGYVHEIGDFKINLYFQPDEDKHCIRWTNLTRKKVWDRDEDRYITRHAPHIFESGFACMGNYQKEFPRLIANYEMATAAIMAIRFPESANVNDTYGRQVKYWPRADQADIDRYRRDGINQFKGVKV